MGTLLEGLQVAQSEPPLIAQHLIISAMEIARYKYQYEVAITEVARVIEDTVGIEDCTEQQVQSWAETLVIRMIQMRQQVPEGWTKVSKCIRCGPVWSDHGVKDMLSCGWCWMRVEGKSFPRP